LGLSDGHKDGFCCSSKGDECLLPSGTNGGLEVVSGEASSVVYAPKKYESCAIEILQDEI
jgi:hypothetical protein